MSEQNESQSILDLNVNPERLDFWEKWLDEKDPKEIAKMISHFEELAKTDFLLGILNRNGLEEEIHKIDLASKNKEVQLLIIFADVDGLRETNNTLGHPEGDKRLVNISNNINQVLDPEDVFGRYGGDEFLIFVKKNDETQFDISLKRIQEALPQGESLSMGYHVWDSRKEESIVDAIKAADDKMYDAKHSLPDHSGKIEGVEFVEV